MHRRIRAGWIGAVLLAVGLGWGGPVRGQSAQQPSLTVDRDPVESPDPDVPVPAAASQTQSAGQTAQSLARENGRYTLRQDAYEVRLNATVIDGSGRSILDLTKDAFHVYEDGVPQTISSFRHEDLPVSLGILIDSSGSMYDKKTAVEQASLNLVKLSNPQDEAFLVDFSWEAFIDQDFTSDIGKLQQGLGYIKASGGECGLLGEEREEAEAGAAGGDGRRG